MCTVYYRSQRQMVEACNFLITCTTQTFEYDREREKINDRCIVFSVHCSYTTFIDDYIYVYTDDGDDVFWSEFALVSDAVL